ncbi:MAG: TonB-dependent receptor plug domain-containing protein, partial [bacterium]|nr:TonB-dependent receptor plug domain-containing protein [bacterium]
MIVVVGILIAESVFLSYTKVLKIDKKPYLIKIDRKMYEDKNMLTLDEVLERHLDIFISRQSSPGTFTTIRSRGVPSSANMQVLYDGVPLGMANASFIDFSAIPITGIEGIEFVKGGNSYGAGPNAIGGSINIVPADVSDKDETKISYIDSSFKTNSLSVTVKTRRLLGSSAVFSYSKNSSAGYMENTKFDQNNFYTKFKLKNLDASITTNESFSGAPLRMQAFVPIEDWDGSKERQAYDKNGYARNRWEIYKLQYNYINTKLILNHFSHNYLFYDGIWNSTFTTNETQSGAEVKFDFENTGIGASIYQNSFDGTNVTTTSLVSFFAEKKFDFESLGLLANIRGDKHSQYGQFLTYRFETELKYNNVLYYINTSRNFRAPSFLELYGFGGNPNLYPEDSVSYNLGLRSIF